MKTLNIEMTVRHMEAQNILTSSPVYSYDAHDKVGDGNQLAPGRTATPAAPGSFRN